MLETVPGAADPADGVPAAVVEHLHAPGATHIGGQALLEGVMMRGKLNWAVAVRKADGEIYIEEHPLPGGVKTGWKKWPIARGVWAMYETLALSMKAFGIAAQFAGGEEEEEQLTSKEIAWTMVAGVALAVVTFIIIPAVLTNLVVGNSLDRPVTWNVVDGILRLVVFFIYIWGVGFVPDIKRVFAYHGAEHKTIHAYEHGVPLEPESIQRYGTLHVRCGTAFLLMVMVIAILVFSLVPGKAILGSMGVSASWAVVLFNIAIRIVLLPVVAGLAYEITVKWAGNRPDNPFVKVLLWPGMQMQRMTTREPDDGMVEVAVAALKAVADAEARAAAGTGDVPAVGPEPIGA